MEDENKQQPSLPPGDDVPNWTMVNSQGAAQSPSGSSAMTPPPFQPAPAPAPRGNGRGFIIGAGVTALAILLGAGIGHSFWPASTSTSSQSAPVQTAPPQGSSSGTERTSSTAETQAIAAKVNPSLVDINTNLGYQGAQAAGTGMVMSSNGLVLTNNHVINGATKISATDIGNGKTYTAVVVGYNRTSDVAVIQLQNASGLSVAPFGNSKTVSVGQAVVGIGNAGGTGGTPSTAAGTVTALDQSITASDESSSNTEQLTGLIQTDAPIQPGESGGPLVTTSSKIIGMDTAASANFSFNQGTTQGFAIPINSALSIAHQIVAGHASDTIHIGATGFLGVQVQATSGGTSSSGQDGGPGATGTSIPGVSVAGTLANSPAAKSGLVNGDTITAVNNVTVNSPSDLTAALSRFHPGDSVTIKWTDANGQKHAESITLETGPAA